MNMPKFTGEASLYQANGQYRTGSQVIHSSVQMINSITPAEIRGEVPIDVPGEGKIFVHSCAPGWIDIGGTCWPAPLSEPSPGGGSGAPGGGSTGSGPGGGGGGVPFDKPTIDKPPPRLKKSPETGTPFKPEDGEACHAIEYKWGGGVTVIDKIISKGEYGGPLSGGVWVCRPLFGPGNDERCGIPQDLGNGDTRRVDCYNGYAPR